MPDSHSAYSIDNSAHEELASWFLGPKGENHEFMKIAFGFIVDHLRKARQDFHPEDGVCFLIFRFVQTAQLCFVGIHHRRGPIVRCFQEGDGKAPRATRDAVWLHGRSQHPLLLSSLQCSHELRYHPCRYSWLPGELLAHSQKKKKRLTHELPQLTMLYNPNNVAPEASPLTSLMEYEVGQDLCEMLGFTRQPTSGPRESSMDPNADPLAWGHITCDGSIANLEAIW